MERGWFVHANLEFFFFKWDLQFLTIFLFQLKYLYFHNILWFSEAVKDGEWCRCSIYFHLQGILVWSSNHPYKNFKKKWKLSWKTHTEWSWSKASYQCPFSTIGLNLTWVSFICTGLRLCYVHRGIRNIIYQWEICCICRSIGGGIGADVLEWDIFEDTTLQMVKAKKYCVISPWFVRSVLWNSRFLTGNLLQSTLG